MSGRIEHAVEMPERPREPGIANRIEQIKRARQDPSLLRGLCMSCLDSGFVHKWKGNEVGVIADSEGRLIYCACEFGNKQHEATEKAKREREKRGR